MKDTGRVLVTPPAAEPILLADAKAHLREDGTAQDDVISALTIAAREYVEARAWRALITQTWDVHFARFPVGGMAFELPLPPLQTIGSIKYIDTDGNEQTLSSALYQVDATSEPACVRAAYNTTWPEVRDETLKAVTIRMTVGYGAADDVPARLKQAMYLLIGHWYANREDVVVGTITSQIREGVEDLIGLTHARAMIG